VELKKKKEEEEKKKKEEEGDKKSKKDKRKRKEKSKKSKKETSSTKKLESVSIRYVPSIPSNTVSLAGTFNNWTPQQLQKEESGAFVGEVTLMGGEKHLYKFVLEDGKWVHDEKSPNEIDAEGNVNNFIVANN